MTKADLFKHLLNLNVTGASVRGVDGAAAGVGTLYFDNCAVDIRDLTAEEKRHRKEAEAKQARSYWDEEKGWVDPLEKS